MLLHTGSGVHAHEYSGRATSTPRLARPSGPSPLSRSAFSAPLTTTSSTLAVSPRPILGQRARAWSEHNPLPRKAAVVRFQEAEQDAMSDDGRSEGSSSMAADGGRRAKRARRARATFLLAHPAPTATHKLLRPKLLLQLQQISTTRRPRPSLDVLPSTTVAPRLRKRFPRMFRSKGELGCNDIMIVRSEDYEAGVDNPHLRAESDRDGPDRELVAVICQMPRDSGGAQGKAELVLSDGALWLCSPSQNGPNGPYEFQHTDADGKTVVARWVKARNRPKSLNGPDALAHASAEQKFTFSVVEPSRRRHPIMATMTQTKLDIPDSYTSTSSSAGLHPPTAATRTWGEETDDDAPPERTTVVLEESLKTLIQVTGIWVALRQGWSQCFKYNDAATSPTSHPGPGSAGRKSSSVEPARLSPSPTLASFPESGHSSLGSVIGGKIRRNPGFGSPASGNHPPPDKLSTTPRRVVSSGTAFVQRAAARRAGAAISTVPSDSEDETLMDGPLGLAQTDGASDPKRFSWPPTALPTTPPPAGATAPRPGGRPLSYQPTTGRSVPNGVTARPPAGRHSMGDAERMPAAALAARPKLGKWKAFTNIFRRTRHSAGSKPSP